MKRLAINTRRIEDDKKRICIKWKMKCKNMHGEKSKKKSYKKFIPELANIQSSK